MQKQSFYRLRKLLEVHILDEQKKNYFVVLYVEIPWSCYFKTLISLSSFNDTVLCIAISTREKNKTSKKINTSLLLVVQEQTRTMHTIT